MKNNKKLLYSFILCFLFLSVFCMSNTYAKKHNHNYMTTTTYKQKDAKFHKKTKKMKCIVKGCKQKVTTTSYERHDWITYSKSKKWCWRCGKWSK